MAVSTLLALQNWDFSPPRKLFYFGVGGHSRPPNPPARIVRTAREYEARMARNIQSHMFRPTITDMQDKYCGDCYDIYTIQSQYTKVAACGRHHKRGGAAFGRATSFVVSFVLALNRVNIVAVTTILVFHVGNGRFEHVRLDIMFRAVRASCSLAVRAMRACAQGWSRPPCPPGAGSILKKK